MIVAISVLFWAIVALTCPLFFLGAVVVWAVTLPFDRRRVVLHLYSSAWAAFYLYVNPLWRIRVSGRHLLPWRGGAVLVANHSSLVDVLALFALFRPYKWVSKASMFKVPLMGWNMRLNGYVPLVRGSGTSVRTMMARCGSLLRAGAPVFFFPEGSRSADGRLGTFKMGAFSLAVDHQVPVYPIAVWGTRDALPKHGLTFRGRANIRVQVLPPLLPADHPTAEELRDATHRVLAEALVASPAPEGG
jgi:1-acyl-sn-glycerol-3-phosphate acyltransferase